MCRSIISLSNIAHPTWHNHPFSQRNKTTERAVGLGVGGNKERGVGYILKKGGLGLGLGGLDEI